MNNSATDITTPEKAFDVLHAFDRWPPWLWACWETIELAEWLRGGNNVLPATPKPSIPNRTLSSPSTPNNTIAPCSLAVRMDGISATVT